MDIPIKSLGIIAIFIIIGSGMGYIIAPAKIDMQTITHTKTVEKSNTLTETTTATIQMRETVTSSVAGNSTTTTITTTPGVNTTTTTKDMKGRYTIYKFQGFNNTITEDFNITEAQWIIKYNIESRGEPFHFIMYVYRSGQKGSVYEEFVTERKAGSKSLVIKSLGPEFYLNIKSKNVKWTIEIQVEY